MKSVKFEGCNLEIGKGQSEYNVIHAIGIPGPEGEIVACYELDDEEIAELVKTKRIYYHRLTFGQPFQPMRLTTDLSSSVTLK